MTHRDPLDLALPVAIVILTVLTLPAHMPQVAPGGNTSPFGAMMIKAANATQNLSASLNRLVLIASIGAGSVVTLAWCRVAISWFSNDPSKKITAKDRAKDAALGTFVLLAAVSGLAWGLAHWVLTGS